jgi:Kef-type K+ transport system membrane component KefB
MLVLRTVAVLLVAFGVAKLAGGMAGRLRLPVVVGELIAGVLVGPYALRLVIPTPTISAAAQLGAITLLFLVGLQTRRKDLRSIGVTAVAVTLLGVSIPFVLVFSFFYLLGYPTVSAVFIGAALIATSVGITARILTDNKLLAQRAATIILAAAIIDDILSLAVLAMIAGLSGRPLNASTVASSLGIIVAFVGGIVIAETRFVLPVRRAVKPLGWFLIPIFFLIMGTHINVAVFADLRMIGVTLAVFVLAVVGKIVGGMIATTREGWRVMIQTGVGMVPRGEVGLIIGLVGLTMGVIKADIYTVIVAVSLLTTLVTSPLLRLVFAPSFLDPARK